MAVGSDELQDSLLNALKILTLFQHFFGMPEPDQLFNVLLHFATLLAVCVVYWRDIWDMVVEFFAFFGDLFSPDRDSPGIVAQAWAAPTSRTSSRVAFRADGKGI